MSVGCARYNCRGNIAGKATQVADAFHVVKLANAAVGDVRRRVHNDTTGGRGTTRDPLYRIPRLLLTAAEPITHRGHAKPRGLLAAGDPLRRMACQTDRAADLPDP